MKKLNKKGFTIIELVIVIAVIAILAAVLIPTFSNVIKKAKQSNALQAAASVYQECLALDMADGEQDNKEGTTDITLENHFSGNTYKMTALTYTVAGTTVTFSATINGFVVTRSATDGTFSVTDAE